MNCQIFLEWFKNTFIPAVKCRQRRDGIKGKVVLLLDNAPSHPSAEELNSIDPDFEVCVPNFFPGSL